MDPSTLEPAEASRWFQTIIPCAVPLVLLIVGLLVGTTRERAHLKRLAQREAALTDMLVTDLRSFPQVRRPGAMLVVGEAVISSDYLKSFLAGLQKLVGGELRGYEVLAMRARREAIVRMLEQAKAAGFTGVCNLRIESADLSGQANPGQQGVVLAGVIASGTAYRAATGPDG